MGGEFGPEWVGQVRERLLAWFESEGRDLPWRRDRDPYRILVSEMMLVQTTVAAVVPFFERFVRSFPDFRSLAGADEAAVLKAWEGLGYYRRARQLHAAAKAVVERHGGRMPDDPAAVRELPGVGRYMAGAILSQAFDRPEPIVEANSRRVLARLSALTDDLSRASAQESLWELAAKIVHPVYAGNFNQALMELGALACTPRSPKCLICPIAAQCEARKLGVQGQIPRVTPKSPPSAVEEACVVAVLSDRVLAVQRAGPGLWAGFWEFPTVHRDGPDPAGRSAIETADLAEGARRVAGVPVAVGPLKRSLTYGVTRYKVRLDAFAASPAGDAAPSPGPGFARAAWVEAARLDELTMSAPSRRLVAAILADPQAWGLAIPGRPEGESPEPKKPKGRRGSR